MLAYFIQNHLPDSCALDREKSGCIGSLSGGWHVSLRARCLSSTVVPSPGSSSEVVACHKVQMRLRVNRLYHIHSTQREDIMKFYWGLDRNCSELVQQLKQLIQQPSLWIFSPVLNWQSILCDGNLVIILYSPFSKSCPIHCTSRLPNEIQFQT